MPVGVITSGPEWQLLWRAAASRPDRLEVVVDRLGLGLALGLGLGLGQG